MGFFNVDTVDSREIAPGVHQKILTGRDGKVMAVWYRITEGNGLPIHDHPHEQVGILLEGEARFTLEGEERTLRPGDGWEIPGGVPHGAMFTRDSIVIDVFYPPREDFLRE